MIEHTTSAAAPVLAPAALPPLLGALWRLLWAHRPAVRQGRCFDRLRALVLGQVCAVARHTVTQGLLALGLVDADPSAFYRLVGRARLDTDALAHCYVRETLADVPADSPYVAVVDGVQIPRHSRTMPGTAWLKCPRTPPWKPGSHRAQFFVHLAALLPRWQGYSRALPLRLDPAFPPKAVPGAAEPRTEGQAALLQMRWLRAELDAAGRRAQELLVLGDGHYDTVDLWTQLPERTVLLVRTACNRVLYDLPPPGARRNRRYGARAQRPDSWLAERRGWQRATVRVRGRDLSMRYRVAGPFVRQGAPGQPLFLLVVGGSVQAHGRYRRRRKPAFFLVNAVQRDGQWVLPRPAEDLLAWAWQRWEVEVAHREMKSEFGVGEAQCWSAIATVRAVQLQAWAYALCVLAGYRAWGYDRHPRFARGVWWGGAPRWSLRTLWRGYQQALGQAPARHPARAIARGTWAEMDAWLHQMDALGAAALVG
jgi:hypothetical protein